jgi:hypothetical protein
MGEAQRGAVVFGREVDGDGGRPRWDLGEPDLPAIGEFDTPMGLERDERAAHDVAVLEAPAYEPVGVGFDGGLGGHPLVQTFGGGQEGVDGFRRCGDEHLAHQGVGRLICHGVFSRRRL